MTLFPRPGRRDLALVGVAAVAVAGLVALQLFAIRDTARRADETAREVARLDPAAVPLAKDREELTAQRIDNQLQARVPFHLLQQLGGLATLVGALIGGWYTLRNYFAARDKERLDRAASELKDALGQLAASDPRVRVAGVVALQHFLRPEQAEMHRRALSALVSIARAEEDREVLRAIRLAAAEAVRQVAAPVLHEVSWQWARLKEVDWSGSTKLAGLDLRDADLENAALQRLVAPRARLRNAALKGAQLDGADLSGADLTYADLAGASLRGAKLTGARLAHVKIANADLSGADLTGAEFGAGDIPWHLARNWREARLPPELTATLGERFGADAAHGLRLTLILWEYAPFVAGGTWTACHHLVRSLLTLGSERPEITLVVPWAERLIEAAAFGPEVRVIALGLEPPATGSGPYDAGLSPYRGLSSYDSLSSYGTLSNYARLGGPSVYDAGRSAEGMGSRLFHLQKEFVRRVAALPDDVSADVILAEDWVTFPAAAALAERSGVPWIAHFHSLEADRRPEDGDPLILALESRAVQGAAAVVVPSEQTRGRLVAAYGNPERLHVVPNPFLAEPVPLEQMGAFETRRVVYLGRLAAQKGPDLFAAVAAEVRRRTEGVHFVAYGGGENHYRWESAVSWYGELPWAERGRAFAGASLVLVPSRAEPFGMVVLEAIQHRVPVLYPAEAGVAEVLADPASTIHPDQIAATADAVLALVTDRTRWFEALARQEQALDHYAASGRGVRELMGVCRAVG